MQKNYTRQQIFERDKGLCWLCGNTINLELIVPHPLSLTLDHIVPKSKGGRDIAKNVACAHKICNEYKSDKMPEEWFGIHQGILTTGAVTVLLLTIEQPELYRVLDKLACTRNKKLKEQIKEIQKYLECE